MSKHNNYNPPDADDAPPPAYQEVATPPFNPNYVSHSHSPPHTPDISYQQQAAEGSQTLYPQIPVTPVEFPQPHHYTPPTTSQQPQYHMPQAPSQQQQYGSLPQAQRYQPIYQTIDIPYTATTSQRRDTDNRRKFPLAAIFFLFGW